MPPMRARFLPLLVLLAASACAAQTPMLPPAPRAGVTDTPTVRVALRVDEVFMNDTRVQPQEIDSFLAVAERFGARVELSVIPARLTSARNADGRMAAFLREDLRRGHGVSQHGYTHRHAPTGGTGGEFMDPNTGQWLPDDTIRAQIARGRAVLEAATGVRPGKYVGVGTDRQMEPPSLRVLRGLGFRVVTNPDVARPTTTDSLSYVPDLTDYTWALDAATYDSTLDAARADFATALALPRRPGEAAYFAVGFHDHFTRWGWERGLVARWLGDLLAWMERQPGVRIEYVLGEDTV